MNEIFLKDNKYLTIEDGVLTNCDKEATEIIIPNGVTRIGEWAFEDCSNLKNVTIPKTLTCIEDWAFYGCENLKEIIIPNSVTSIGKNAFIDCLSLQEIKVDQDNKNYASIDGVLYNKDKTILIKCPEAKETIIISDSVKCIGYGAFCNCKNLKEIIIPNNVTSIEKSAFEDCSNLQEITIPNSVTSVEDCVFDGCKNLQLIKAPEGLDLSETNYLEDCIIERK